MSRRSRALTVGLILALGPPGVEPVTGSTLDILQSPRLVDSVGLARSTRPGPLHDPQRVQNSRSGPYRGPTASANQAGPGLPGSRIRTDSPILRTLIRDASERSQTFRALVAAIDATDGLVYLSVGTCGRLRACLLHRVTLAGEYRVLNILVNLRPLSTDPTPAIGHELQHVLEVLSDSTITTDEGIVAFYRFHARRIRGVLETDAAIRVGDAVRAELRRTISP
jgi:hypothetical protein